MLIVKLALVVLAFVAFAVGQKLSNQWRDRRTKQHRIGLWIAYIVALISFLGTLVVVVGDHQVKRNEVLSERRLPLLDSSVEVADFRMGSNSLVVFRGASGRGFNWSPFIISVSQEGRILVNGDLLDERGAIVANLRDSILYNVASSLGYDSNSDTNGLEVVNPKGEVVIQVHSLAPSAVWEVSFSTFSIDKGKAVHVVADAQSLRKFLPGENVEAEIAPIFCYPSNLNPSVRNGAPATCLHDNFLYKLWHALDF